MASNTHKYVFMGLQVVALLIFIGLCIEAGGLLVNFVYSIFSPVNVSNLYQKLDLSDMYAKSVSAFYGIFSFILIIAILKAYLFYILILLLQKMNLKNPFSAYVSEQITKVAYCTFSIGIMNYFGTSFAKNLEHKGFAIEQLNPFWMSTESFILMSAIIYVIALIFQRGVELQNENELTV